MPPYNITVNSSSSVSPNTVSIATGPVTIVWALGSTALSWQANGIQIAQNNSVSGPTNPTGSPTWQGGQPSPSGSTYQVSFNNNMSGQYVFTYAVNVSGSPLRDDHWSSGNNPPVIQNEGGGPFPPYDPDKD